MQPVVAACAGIGQAPPEIMQKRPCTYCEGQELRRLNRAGFVERQVLPLLGYYPWECALCRRKVFLRTDGVRKARPAGAETTK